MKWVKSGWILYLLVVCFAVICTIVVVTCGPPEPIIAEATTTAPSIQVEKVYGSFSFDLYRVIDVKEGNVCYIVNGSTTEVIVCLPMEDR
jgi:hypothetical protein